MGHFLNVVPGPFSSVSYNNVTRMRNVLFFFVLSPIFFTFAAVMCDFLNRDVRFWKVDSADRWDSVGPKFSRMFLF